MERSDHQADHQHMSEDSVDSSDERHGEATDSIEVAAYREATVTSTVPTKAFDNVTGPSSFQRGSSNGPRPSTSGTTEGEAEQELIEVRERVSQFTQAKAEQAQEPVSLEPRFYRNEEVMPDAGFMFGKAPGASLDLKGNRKRPSAIKPAQQLQASGCSHNKRDDVVQHRRKFQPAGSLDGDSTEADGIAEPSSESVHAPEQQPWDPTAQSSVARHSLAEALDPRQDCTPDRQLQDEMEQESVSASSDNERPAAQPQDANDVEMTDATFAGRGDVDSGSQQEIDRDERGAEKVTREESVASTQSPVSDHPADRLKVTASSDTPVQPLGKSMVPSHEGAEERSEMFTLYDDFRTRIRQHEKQLMAKHSEEQRDLKSRLDQVTLEKAAVERMLVDVQQQSRSQIEELKNKFSRTADGLKLRLVNLGIDYVGLEDAFEKDSNKVMSHFASLQKIEMRLRNAHGMHSGVDRLTERTREKLKSLQQEIKATLRPLEERNQALTTQLRDMRAQAEEQHDHLAKLEKHLKEQSLLLMTLANEVPVLLEANKKSVTTQFDALVANVNKQRGTGDSTFAETLQGLRDDIKTLGLGDSGVKQNLLVIEDTVQKLVESASNQSEHSKVGRNILEAVNALKSGLELILQPVAEEVKALTSHMEGAEAQRLESAALQQQIQDKDARLLAEHATSSRLQTEVDQLKKTLDSRPLQVPVDPRQQYTQTREEQETLLDAGRAELSLKMRELSVANASLKDLEAEKEVLQQRLNTFERAASVFGAEKLELQRKANEALTTKEREMSAVSMRAQAAERAKSDNEIKRLTKELENLINALEASRRTSTSEQSLRDRVLTQGQRIEELERLLADEAFLKSAHDNLSAEISTLKSQLSASNTQKMSALGKQAEAQRLLSEAQTSEKQCKSDLQQSRTRESTTAGEIDRLAARQEANLKQIKQSYASKIESESVKQEELISQHAAEIDKLRAEKNDALKQAEGRLKEAESALKILESRLESEGKSMKDSLSRATAERDFAVAGMQRMRDETEVTEARHENDVQASMTSTAGGQQEGSFTIDHEPSRPRKQRKKIVRAAEPIYRGPIVEETQATESTTGVFSQIARPGQQAEQGEDFSAVDEMLDDAMLSSQQPSLEASQFRATEDSAPQQAGLVVEETQQSLEGDRLDQSPPAEKAAARAKLPSLRGKLIEQPSAHSQAISGWSPGPDDSYNSYWDGHDRHSSQQGEMNLEEEEPKPGHRKPFAKPNSASKMAPRRLQNNGEANTTAGTMDDRRAWNHESTSSSPAFVASQTHAVSRTNTYQAPGSAGRLIRLSRTPSAPSTVDPRLLQVSSQLVSTTTLKRGASTTLDVNADSLEDSRRKFRRTNTKASVVATSPPSQHTRLRQSANDLPAMPKAAPRSRGMREASVNTSSQSRVRSLAGSAGTPRGNKRGKKSSKNDEMNARFDQELSSRR